jgi:glycosyltransferase involved in cell wall biosynthesis
MRIAQVAPLSESVPPALYGGTERVVHWLTEGLVARGHDVTLFASADSRTRARLVPCAPRALRLAKVKDFSPWTSGLVRDVVQRANGGDFDVVHAHVDHWGFVLSSAIDVPVIHTMHGRMDDEDHHPLYARAREALLVSISDNQRLPVPDASWIATIHHGMPLDLFEFHPRSEGPRYALFLGRISPEKRPDLAIDVARRAGIPLKIAAKVDPKDRAYFEAVVAPLLDGPGVEFLGEVDDVEKARLLGGAEALLFPIDWPEPFGLVVIEALACGTPVVARPCGALPELLEDGRTGFLAREPDELAAALSRARELDRAECRDAFERRFSRERMVADYERLYSVLATQRTPASVPRLRLAA